MYASLGLNELMAENTFFPEYYVVQNGQEISRVTVPLRGLTYWGRVMHINVSKLGRIIGSDNDLVPVRCQAITWTNAGVLLIWPFENKFQWNLNQNTIVFIQEKAFENVVCQVAAILSRTQYV